MTDQKAHITGLKSVDTDRCNYRSCENERVMQAVQMVSMTGVIIVGNYTKLVILCLHSVIFQMYFQLHITLLEHSLELSAFYIPQQQSSPL